MQQLPLCCATAAAQCEYVQSLAVEQQNMSGRGKSVWQDYDLTLGGVSLLAGLKRCAALALACLLDLPTPFSRSFLSLSPPPLSTHHQLLSHRQAILHAAVERPHRARIRHTAGIALVQCCPTAGVALQRCKQCNNNIYIIYTIHRLWYIPTKYQRYYKYAYITIIERGHDVAFRFRLTMMLCFSQILFIANTNNNNNNRGIYKNIHNFHRYFYSN